MLQGSRRCCFVTAYELFQVKLPSPHLDGGVTHSLSGSCSQHSLPQGHNPHLTELPLLFGGCGQGNESCFIIIISVLAARQYLRPSITPSTLGLVRWPFRNPPFLVSFLSRTGHRKSRDAVSFPFCNFLRGLISPTPSFCRCFTDLNSVSTPSRTPNLDSHMPMDTSL